MGYQNPFSDFSQHKLFYIGVVMTVSLGTAIILVSFGPTAYGVSAEGVIWIQDRTNQYNWLKVFLFYVEMAFIYVYCLWTLIRLTMRLNVGFGDSLKNRLSCMKRTRSYIIGYTIFW